MPPVSDTFMCPGEASPDKNIKQIIKISVEWETHPTAASEHAEITLKPITKAIYLNQKHSLNQFNLICEFASFLYQAKITRVLPPVQKQQWYLLGKKITTRFGETGAVSMSTCTLELGSFSPDGPVWLSVAVAVILAGGAARGECHFVGNDGQWGSKTKDLCLWKAALALTKGFVMRAE